MPSFDSAFLNGLYSGLSSEQPSALDKVAAMLGNLETRPDQGASAISELFKRASQELEATADTNTSQIPPEIAEMFRRANR